jgi:uncharacterized membrane protein
MKGKAIQAHWGLWLLVAGSFILSAFLYNKLPDQMPMHWNFAGEVDRYGSKLEGAFLMPFLNAGILFMLIWLPVIDPKRASYERFESFYKLFQWIMVIFFTIVHALVLVWSLGYQISIGLYVKLAVGLLFMILGNYMGKVGPNWFVGIKTPWTLENPEVWTKTHRLAGPLFFAAGIIIALMAFVDGVLSFWIIMISTFIAAFVPIIYSYFIYR